MPAAIIFRKEMGYYNLIKFNTFTAVMDKIIPAIIS